MGNQERKDSVLVAFELFWEVLGASQVAQGVNNPPAYAGDAGLIPGVRRSPGGGNGNPFQYPCLEDPPDRGAWQATVHRAAKSLTRLK